MTGSLRHSAVRTAALAGAVGKTFRARDILRRTAYEARRRTGLLSRTEARHSRVSPIDARWHLEAPPADVVDPTAPDVADRILAGALPLYGGRPREVGWPPVWHVNPDSGVRLPDKAHWTTLDDSGRDGDIKDVWEISRFGFVGPLVRAWASTGDDRYPEAFWLAVEDWTRTNPPFLGPNWMCGQETSLRAISLLFGLGVFAHHPATTPARRALLSQVVGDSVRRVRPTIGYALSQRNNHAISETSFLLAAAHLLPGHEHLVPRARRALKECLADQFYDDGSYAQYSPTYQRLALHGLLFLDLVHRTVGSETPPEVERVLSSSYRFLLTGMDDRTGWLPNAGGNDGALLFDLSGTHRRDFRPVLTTLAARTGTPRPFAAGRWDEEARWFGFLPPPSRTPPPATLARSGFTVLRGADTHAVLRAGRRRHRPAHADMLHVDLWMDGVNVAADPGTYRYSAPAPWGNALAGEAVHNVPIIPGRPQGVRQGRFFWTEWHDAEVVEHSRRDRGEVLVARLRLGNVVLHRLLGRSDQGWVVLDRASSGPVAVRWNLPQASSVEDHTVRHEAFVGRFRGGSVEIATPDPDDPTSGWSSPTYGELEACTALTVDGREGWTEAWFVAPDVTLPNPDEGDAWWEILTAVERGRAPG